MKKTLYLVVPLALALAACGDDDGGGGSASGDWCDLATQVEAQDAVFDDMDISDPASIEETFTSSANLLDDAVDAAPDEIRDDVQTVADAFGTLVDELESVDWNFMELDSEVLSSMGTEVEEASDRIAEYSETECGIPADDGSGTTEEESSGEESTEEESTEEESAATMPASGSINDMLVQQFQQMGMSEDEAECLVENIDVQEFMQSQDVTAIMDAFQECDIDPTSLGG